MKKFFLSAMYLFIVSFALLICRQAKAVYSDGKIYVVIGSSAAGLSAVKRLASCVSQNDRIILISKEAEFYDKRRLKRYMQKERSPVLSLPTSDTTPIEFMHKAVEHIDRYDKKVICSDGTHITYDSLFLGIGAEPVVPNIEGMDGCEGVFGYHTLSNVRAIKEYVKSHNVKNIVVIGGGLASLELTEVLVKQGYAVHQCVRGSRILRNKADVGGALYIQDLFSKHGAQWHFNTEVTRVVSSDSLITGVVLNNQSELAVDMMIYAIGTNVATNLVEGLKTDKGAFSVDTYMRTSDPYIYAGGDAACVWDYVNQSFVPNGKWFSAKEQGHYAAKNMCGNQIAYPGIACINFAKYFKNRVALSGPMENPPFDYIYTTDMNKGWLQRIIDAIFGIKEGYRSFLKKNEQLRGFCLIGVPSNEIRNYANILAKKN